MARVIKSTHPTKHYADGGFVEKAGRMFMEGYNKASQAMESPEKKKARADMAAESAAADKKFKDKCAGERTVYGKAYTPGCEK